MKRTLKNLIALESNVKIYVPSTISTNIEIDNSLQVDKLLTEFSMLFGGATSYAALGCWMSNTLGLIKERVTIVEAYCHETELKHSIDKILELAETLKNEMNQETVSLEVNGKLYFI